ncbi:thioesterase family protein [Hymenobacter aerilatus]|uniref:Thioesterase family protein n=1 Tax=Hymenobacter aerilatus TaxID=2932251 RepID=A0A8T9SUG2_9BACT|nr:thioesterase family protein [Hymenobacter aerilatus]UOR05001.1 thioesterase family protein [Hymenobacter aerilatus]
MPRVKVELPDAYLLTVELPIRITDLNYGAHLGNDALLSLLHEARVQFLQFLGQPEYDPATQQGFIMADVAVEYKGEGFYGDTLQLQLAASDVHKYGFDVVYLVKNQHGKEIARAKTGMLSFDYTTRKLRPLPEAVLRKLAPHPHA